MKLERSRRLIYVPIVHTAVDLGSHQPQVRKAHIDRYGPTHWHEHVQTMEAFWTCLRERILALAVDHTKVRLYQDGLPVCAHELEIARDLAEGGSRNHQLLLELVAKGATLVGTEDPVLLLDERKRLLGKEVLRHTSGPDSSPLYDELLERRDEHIARRIAATLGPGEVGIAFIGALHRVVEKLPGDIEVEYLPSEGER